jgi:hypothetical protein
MRRANKGYKIYIHNKILRVNMCLLTLGLLACSRYRWLGIRFTSFIYFLPASQLMPSMVITKTSGLGTSGKPITASSSQTGDKLWMGRTEYDDDSSV